MKVHEYGDPNADIVLIQPIGGHELDSLQHEILFLSGLVNRDFRWIGFQVENWNQDLSPWKAPAAFGNDDFGDGASDLLNEILKYGVDQSKTCYLGGYSLAGLFALWAAYQTDVFDGIAAVSPSMWFPGFAEYMAEHELKSKHIYLSLGDKEEKTRNPVMRMVGDKIRAAHAGFKENKVDCILEWNQGNHFREPDLRTAKGFAWLIKKR